MSFYGNIHEISMNDYFNSIKFKKAYSPGGENTFPDADKVLGSSVQLTATVPAQQIEFATGNQWIEFEVNDDNSFTNDAGLKVAYGVTLYHKQADGDVTDTLIDFEKAVYTIDNTTVTDSDNNSVLNYGGLIEINSFGFDAAGHASGTTDSKKTYVLPQIVHGQYTSNQTKYDHAKELYDQIEESTGQTKLDKQKDLSEFLRNYPFSAEQVLTPMAKNTNSIATLNHVVNPHKNSYQPLDPNNYTLISDIQAGDGLQKDISILNNRTVNMHTDISNLNVTAGIATGTQKPGIHFISVGDSTDSYVEYTSPTNFDLTNPHYIKSGLHGEMFNKYDVSGISTTNSKLSSGNNIVLGKYGHAEGVTRAIGNYSHSENGYESGGYSYSSIAHGVSSHAEGRSHIRIEALPIASQSSTDKKNYTLVINRPELDTILDDSDDNVKINDYLNNICVGIDVLKDGVYKHKIYPVNSLNKEPQKVTFQITVDETETIANNLNVELYTGIAYGDYSHVEGRGCIARGSAAHAEGLRTVAIGTKSHAEGCVTTAIGLNTHAEGYYTKAQGNNSHAEGSSVVNESTREISSYLIALGNAAHAEGRGTWAGGRGSHTEGYQTKTGIFKANGEYTDNTGSYAHAEGEESVASGEGAHAEGKSTIAEGAFSHAEGISTKAKGEGAHAEGSNTTTATIQANGKASHAEGGGCIADGDYSHAEGEHTRAIGTASHSSGIGTIAVENGSAAFGQFNIDHTAAENKPLFTIGNGVSSAERSDALRVWPSGGCELFGDLRIHGTHIFLPDTANPSKFYEIYIENGVLKCREDGNSIS